MTIHESIILIDEDRDDHRLVYDAHKDLGIKSSLLSFFACEQVIPYLQNQLVLPKLIICDHRFRTMNGLQLRRQILDGNNPSLKTIPFIIWSSVIDAISREEASELDIKGVYLKPSTYGELLLNYNAIIGRWGRKESMSQAGTDGIRGIQTGLQDPPANIFSSHVDMR